ncbi:MAG: hypothetical protein ACR2JC_16025 [Chloroflexota bacterium]
MITRAWILVLLTLVAIVVPARAVTANPVASSPARKSVTIRHGLELTMNLHRRVFERNALTVVSVEVLNVSRHAIHLERGETDNPFVSVLARSGEEVYPPALPLVTPQSDSSLSPQVLDPGQSFSHDVYVVIRGPSLRPVVLLQDSSTRRVAGTAVTVSLRPGPRPQVLLHTSPEISADILPSTTVYGPLIYQSMSACGLPHNGEMEEVQAGPSGWTPAGGTRLAPVWNPACTSGREWHVVAGWLDHPVARVDYVAPSTGTL